MVVRCSAHRTDDLRNVGKIDQLKECRTPEGHSDNAVIGRPHDAVLMEVRSDGAARTIAQAGAGPVARQHYLGNQPSIAEELQARIPTAHVVKAFNLNRACAWAMDELAFDGHPLSIPMAGDDAAAKEVVAELIRSIGCTPIDFGGLEHSRDLEPFAAVLIRLLLERHDQFEVFNLLIRVPEWGGITLAAPE